MIEKPTAKPVLEGEFDLDGALWTPEDDSAPEVIKKDDLEAVDFSKDAKVQTIHVIQQHEVVMEALKCLSNIIKDTENVASKVDEKDIVVACGNAERRSFEAFVILGKMVVAVDKETPFTHPLAVEMGDIWDRTDYSYLSGANLLQLKDNFQALLNNAYEDLDKLEDEWIDTRGEDARLANAAKIHAWVDAHTLKLTKSAKEISIIVNDKRKTIEAKESRPKYDSLGLALKSGDGPEFARMLKLETFDDETLNKLMVHAMKINVPLAVSALAEAGANINAVDDAGYTLFMQAIKSGSVDIAKSLKAAGALMNQKGFNGQTDIVIAAKEGQLEALKYLVEELKLDAADDVYGINAVCWRGFSALIHAVAEDQMETTKYLIKNGADPTQQVFTENFATAFDYAEQGSEMETIVQEAEAAWKAKPKAPKP